MYYGWQVVTVGKKHKVEVGIPKTYSVKRDKEIDMWKATHEENTYMREQFNKQQCCFTHEAQWFIVASLVAGPKLSGAAVEVFMHGIARSILEVLRIEYTEDTIQNILPCKKTIEGWIEDFACSILYVCSARLDEEDGVGAYLSTDKAKEKVKKGMTKVISKWSPLLATPKFPDGQVYICILDSDQTGNTTHEGAEGIENSLKKLLNHELLVFNGIMADSGGGFVREPKKAVLQARGFCHSFSLVANCTCHNIQLTGTIPMKHLFEKGSIGVWSLPQMLFLAHEFQHSVLGR